MGFTALFINKKEYICKMMIAASNKIQVIPLTKTNGGWHCEPEAVGFFII